MDILTDRLCLRPFAAADLPALADLYGRAEAARAVLQKAALPEVFAVIFPDNHASQVVARRLGMRELGITRRYSHFPKKWHRIFVSLL